MAESLSMGQGVWVYAEQRRGQLCPEVAALVAEARRQGERVGQESAAVILGTSVAHLAIDLSRAGAQRIYLVEDPALETGRAEVYGAILAHLCQRHRPAALLFVATDQARELAPRLSARLGLGLAADCVALRWSEGGRLQAVRRAYGGRVEATVAFGEQPVLATMDPRFLPPARVAYPATAEVVSEPAKPAPALVYLQIREASPLAAGQVDLTRAPTVVAGGRGVGGPEGFACLEDLAGLLGGRVGATRAVVDAGWRPAEEMIGQSGKTVSPRLYVACGISGAVQHLVGMRTAEVIVAINRDRAAPIMQIADLAIVGDTLQVVPEMVRRLRGGPA